MRKRLLFFCFTMLLAQQANATSIVIQCESFSESDCIRSPYCKLELAADKKSYQCRQIKNFCENGFIQAQDSKTTCEAKENCRFVPAHCYCDPSVQCFCGGGPPANCVERPPLVDELKQAASNQTALYQEFLASSDPARKNEIARLLGLLWQKGLLDNQLKTRIVQDHFKLTLIQRPFDYPDLEVKATATFPFPDVGVDFTPTRYRNGDADWSPGSPQRSGGLSGAPVGNIISITGGVVHNGDVIFYKIRIEDNYQWQITMETNSIVMRGLSIPDDQDDSLIVPGKRMGPYQLGDDQHHKLYKNRSLLKQAGLEFFFSPQGKLIKIRTTMVMYETAEWIRVGSKMEMVKKRFGSTLNQDKGLFKIEHRYPGILFEEKNGTITAIELFH